MADTFAASEWHHHALEEMTNQAFQEDEEITDKVQSPHSGIQASAQEPVKAMSKSGSPGAMSDDLFKRSLPHSDVNSERPAKYEDRSGSIESKDGLINTVTKADTKRLPTETGLNRSTVDRNTRHLSINLKKENMESTENTKWSRQLSEEMMKSIPYNGAQNNGQEILSQQTRGTGHSVSSPGCQSDKNIQSPGCQSNLSIQSPFTESVCLQMLNDSFDSSAFTTRSSGSELDSSVITTFSAEDDRVNDTDSILTDDVFHNSPEINNKKDKIASSRKMSGDQHRMGSSSSGVKQSNSSNESKFSPQLKHSEKFRKVPVAETDTKLAVNEGRKDEYDQFLNNKGSDKGQTIPLVQELSNELRKNNDNVGPDNSGKAGSNIGHTESVNKSSFHVTHPREYNRSHDTRRTLVMQSDDVIHCQFLDNEHDAYKERRARLSVYSRDPCFMPPRSNDYLQLSCLVMLCCNPLFGIIAFSFSIAVNSTYEAGQYDRSISFSRWSVRMSALGIAVTCFVVLILMIFYWPDNYRHRATS